MTSIRRLLRSVFLLCVAIFGTTVVWGQTITRWPFVQLGAPDSMLIAWHTDVATDSTVQFGTDLSYSSEVVDSALGTDHAVVLTGLSPSTTYHYRVLGGGLVLDDGAVSAEGLTFTTNPDPALTPAPFRFVVFGDSGDGSAAQFAVAAQIETSSPDLGIHTGDLVYENGAAVDFDPKYFSVYRDTIARAVFNPSLGNHDVVEDGGASFVEALHLPTNSPAPERYYSFVYGNARFVALDSNIDLSVGSAQYSWLESELSSASELWKFVYFHHPIYAASRTDTGTPKRAVLEPLFNLHDVDIVFQGHNHNYERMYPLEDGVVTDLGEEPSYIDPQGTIYIVTGGGGRSLNPVSPHAISASAVSVYHHVRVDIADNLLTLTAVDDSGTVFDSMSISKNVGPPPAAPLGLVATGEPEQIRLDWNDNTEPALDGYRVYRSLLPGGPYNRLGADEILVAAGSVWSYDDSGTDLGTAWRQTGYDASGWASGAAQLGYGDGDEATVLSFGPDPNNKYPTYYFRHEFPVGDPTAFAELRVLLQRDDGAVVYINGVEVVRDNMPTGTITYDTFALGAVGGGEETFLFQFLLPPGTLISGNNLIAVEIHQSSGSSSDISFDLELSGLAESNTRVLQSTPITASTGEKPQSKLWEHDGSWWAVLADTSGTWVNRLDGDSWSRVLLLSSKTSVRADVKSAGDLAHVLLFDGVSTQLASVEFVAGQPGTYQPWSARPGTVDVTLTSGVETATIDVDSTGRMWLASDATTEVEVRWSDSPYDVWSAPISLASGIGTDDICLVTTLSSSAIGVLWSNQVAQRFGFRVHADGDDPEAWSADEVPASQSALNVGLGMADDHLNVAVASDGTLYAAIKTSYDTVGYPKIGLLVRRPSGAWDPLYHVDESGTRGIVVLNEALDRLLVVYTSSEGFNDIVQKESSLGAIAFGPRETVLQGGLNDVTSTKQNVVDDLVLLASNASTASGLLRTFSANDPLASEFLDTGVALGQTYHYVVTAVDIFGQESALSNEASAAAQPPDPPNAPTALEATSISTSRIDLTWADNSTDEAGFAIERSLDGASWGEIATVGENVIFYSDEGLDHSTTHHYRVLAFNATGDSDYSNVASATTGSPDVNPPVISGVSATNVTDSSATVIWSTDEPADSLVDYGVDTTYGSRVIDGSLETAHSIELSGLSSDSLYHYRITATDSSGNVATSADFTFTTAPDSTSPTAPTGLVATAGDAIVTLDWSDNAEVDLAGYDVYRSTTSGSGYVLVNGGPLATSDFVDGTVANSTAYYYVVTARDLAGNESSFSNEVAATPQDMTPPAPPAGFVAQAGDGLVELSWSAGAESDLAGYNVYRGTTPGSHPDKLNPAVLAVTSYSDADVVNGSTYYYVARAVDFSGNESADSIEATATPADGTPPSAPQGLVATGGFAQIALDWADSSEPDLAGYNVYRSLTPGGGFSPVNESLVGGSQYVDTNLVAGVTYYYVVTAVDTSSNESSPSSEAAASPLSRVVASAEPVLTAGDISAGVYTDTHSDDGVAQAIPEGGLPGGLKGLDGYYRFDVGLDVADISALELTLNAWFDDADGNLSDAPQVFARDFSAGAWDALGITVTATQDGTSYVAALTPDSHVSGAREVWIRFVDSRRVKRENKDTLFVDEIALDVSGQAGPRPAAPTGLVAVAADSSVSLDWDDNGEPDLAGYSVYRSTHSGGSYQLVDSTSASTSAFNDGSVINGTTYYYVVRAFDSAGGESDDSNEAAATPSDATAPGIPQGLVATAGDALVGLDWSDVLDSDLDGYNVYRSQTPGAGYSLVNSGLVSGSAFSDTGLSNGVIYYYVVTAVDTSGNESSASSEASATPQNGPPLPPVDVTAQAGDGRIDLSWSANAEADIDGYDIHRSTSSGGPYSLVNTEGPVSTVTFADTGLTNGVTYYYVITAVDTGGLESADSSEVSATPLASQSVHVESIEVTMTSKGPNWEGQATVLVHEAGDTPLEGVTVTGDWLLTPAGGTQEVLQSGATGVTGPDGSVLLKSPKRRASTGDVFVFRVTQLSAVGFVYDPDQNTETEASSSVP